MVPAPCRHPLLGGCLLWAVLGYRRSANFCDAFLYGTSDALSLTKTGWAIFWATSSPTHLATLA
jgi:hypothetical protein